MSAVNFTKKTFQTSLNSEMLRLWDTGLFPRSGRYLPLEQFVFYRIHTAKSKIFSSVNLLYEAFLHKSLNITLTTMLWC